MPRRCERSERRPHRERSESPFSRTKRGPASSLCERSERPHHRKRSERRFSRAKRAASLHERSEPLLTSEASAPTTASEASAASHEQSERPLFTSEASAPTAVLAAEGHRRASEGGGSRPLNFDCHSSGDGPLTRVSSLAAQQKRESSPRPQPVLYVATPAQACDTSF